MTLVPTVIMCYNEVVISMRHNFSKNKPQKETPQTKEQHDEQRRSFIICFRYPNDVVVLRYKENRFFNWDERICLNKNKIDRNFE